MAQLSSSSKPNSLPGIVTDQPEIFESTGELSDDTGINDADSMNEPTDEAIAIIDVPVRQAFSYFAERENEIAKFYIQRQGEYKISGDKPDDETEIEKYHRLVSEVNQLLNQFQAERASQLNKSHMSAIGSLDSAALTNNLEILSRQLKALEFAAEDGSLNPSQAEFNNIKLKLDKLEQKEDISSEDLKPVRKPNESIVEGIRLSALERRLNLLETLVGCNESKVQSLFELTKCESLTEVAETLGSWLSLFKPDSAQRVSRDIDYLTQRLETISACAQDQKLDQLLSLSKTHHKYKAMVPTIIHRLNAMEELQHKAAQVTRTVSYLEQIQSEIFDSLKDNEKELHTLREKFATNIELLKECSDDIDSRISAIRKS